MYEVKYTEEQLKKCGLNFLRNYAREIGGTPGLMNKGDLVGYILDIQSGKISPERKKSGRKPLDIKGMNYGLLGLVNIVGEEDEFKEPGTMGEVRGYFEVLADGIGALTDGEKVIVFVPSIISGQYRLKIDDLIEGKWEKGRNNSHVLTSIEKINGKAPNEVYIRSNFDRASAMYPESRITFADLGALGNEIDIFSPVGRGQRCVVLYKKGLDETSLIEKIVSACEGSGVYSLVSYINCRPEDGQYLGSACSEAIWTSFERNGEDHKAAMKRAVERAKRTAESGDHAAIIIGSLSSLKDAFGGDLVSAMKSAFSVAKNTAEVKSVTLFALTDDEKTAEEFEPYCNSLIVTDGKNIDINRSYTRRRGSLLSERELEIAESVSALQGANEKVAEIAKKSKGEEFISSLEKLL